MKYSDYISYLSIMCGLSHIINSAAWNVTIEEAIGMFHGVSQQLDVLESRNEILKLRFELMDLNMEKQQLHFAKLESKLQGIEDNLLRLDRTMAALLKRELIDVRANANHDNQDQNKQTPLDNIQDTGTHSGNNTSNNVGNVLPYSHGYVAIDDSLLSVQEWNATMKKLEDFRSMGIKNKNNCSTEPPWHPIEAGQEIMEQTDETGKPLICVRKADQKLVCSNITLPTSCSTSNSVNCFNHKCRIQNHLYGPESFLVHCDDTTEGGGWIVMQRRLNDAIDFSRNWTEYRRGFGDLDGNYWIGLDKLHALTTTLAPVELLIQLKDYDDVLKYAKYDSFHIGDESTQYAIRDVGAYTGTAGDSFSGHKGMKFSTADRDNDISADRPCASELKSGWWYLDCYFCNLNGLYLKKHEKPIKGGPKGINWGDFHGYDYSMKFVQMLIRPKEIY